MNATRETRRYSTRGVAGVGPAPRPLSGSDAHPYLLVVSALDAVIRLHASDQWQRLVTLMTERIAAAHDARFADMVRFALEQRLWPLGSHGKPKREGA